MWSQLPSRGCWDDLQNVCALTLVTRRCGHELLEGPAALTAAGQAGSFLMSQHTPQGRQTLIVSSGARLRVRWVLFQAPQVHCHLPSESLAR